MPSFDTDGTVPEAAAALLWAHTGNLDALDTEDLLINLCERSLVQLDTSADADGQRRRRLHDLLYDYAVRAAGDRATLHWNLLDAYRDRCPEGWHTGPNDGYFFVNLCNQLIALEAWDDLIGDDQLPGPLAAMSNGPTSTAHDARV
jgi:hypothetical protein